MDRVTIADLEAELGCLYQPAAEPSTQSNNGAATQFYEPPPGALTRLQTETKAPCLYPFGSGGTLAWVNGAGELVNFATNVKNRLIGIDSRKCLERGDEYQSRAKVLEEIARSNHGYVCGIGLSIDANVEDPTVFWVHNQWPRFVWKQDDLDIQLQYLISDGSVIQQYQIRNNGKDNAAFAYTISSDLAFREHGSATPAYPVPTNQTSERIMAYQNSILLLRNPTLEAELEMGVFHNGARRPLWIHARDEEYKPEETPIERFLSSNNLDEETYRLERWEDMFRADFSVKQRLSQADENYYRHYSSLQSKDTRPSENKSSDLSQYHNVLNIAPGSTEELCAIVKLSHLDGEPPNVEDKTTLPSSVLREMDMPEVIASEEGQEQGLGLTMSTRLDMLIQESQLSVLALQINSKLKRKQKEKMIRKITKEEDRLKEKEVVLFSMFKGQQGRQLLLNKIISKHIALGEAYAQLEEVGQARFHFFVSCLIAENISTPLDVKANLSYADFLYAHGWKRRAWTVIQKMDVLRMTNGSSEWIRTQKLLAVMRLDRGEISAAEEVYRKIHVQVKSLKADNDPWPELAQVCERIAWTRAKQERYIEAGSSYTYLASRPYFSSHRTILSNLAFIKRRLGRTAEARHFYQEALAADRVASYSQIDDLQIRSGLYASYLEVGERELAGSLVQEWSVKYKDVNSLLSRLPLLKLDLDNTSIFFGFIRQLESLLSLCSIPVYGVDGIESFAITDADPLNICHDGRVSYFQFRFLIQCKQTLEKLFVSGRLSQNLDAYEQYMDRIQEITKGHLKWVYQTARFGEEKTWAGIYPISGNPLYEADVYRDLLEHTSPMDVDVTRSTDGCYSVLKVYDYVCAYPEQWKFAVDLLGHEYGSKMRLWLEYLARTKYKHNLWIWKTTVESFKLRDLKSGETREVSMVCPHYELSDASFLWLAVSHLESMINLFERNRAADVTMSSDINHAVKSLRKEFERYRSDLDPRVISRNIQRTLVVSKAELSIGAGKEQEPAVGHRSEKIGLPASPAFRPLDSKAAFAEKKLFGDTASRSKQSSDQAESYLAFRRAVNEVNFYFEHTDFASFEVARLKLFEKSDNRIRDTWQATLRLQRENDSTEFSKARSTALTLAAAKSGFTLTAEDEPAVFYLRRLEGSLNSVGAFIDDIETENPGEFFSWATTFETISLIMGNLFEEYSDLELKSHIELPDKRPDASSGTAMSVPSKPKLQHRKTMDTFRERLNLASKVNLGNVFDDKNFLPDWMYCYPDFIHSRQLQIDIEREIQTWNPGDPLRTAVVRWQDRKGFDDDFDNLRKYLPTIIDSGQKIAGSLEQSKIPNRRIEVSSFTTSKELWLYLLQPRTEEKAKKRLIEIVDQNPDCSFICWLAAPRSEKAYLLEFFRRHDVAENYFTESAHQFGNVWQTEFHFGFYQLVDDLESGQGDLGWKSRVRELPKLSVDRSQKFSLGAVSFRFVGDIRDRFWTCHFAARTLKDGGFRGLIGDKPTWASSTKATQFLEENWDQRKILELSFVEKATQEMRTSINDILAMMSDELESNDIRDPRNDSFELIYSRSNLYMRASEVLRDMLQHQKSAITTISEWENRDESRGVKTRWSLNDETRFGEKVRDLTRQCRMNLNQLRVQQASIEEQLRFAEHRHTDLIGYMQLREARMSARSAQDVRLFTYVTIFFLPLSFSSSLFSMQGSPDTSTLTIMIEVTVVALVVTVLALANMKLLDRNWEFWMTKVSASARKKMKASSHTWPIQWKDVSKDLEEVAQRQLAQSEHDRQLPSESSWWYFWFWSSYLIVEIPAARVSSAIAAWNNRDSEYVTAWLLISRSFLGLVFAPVCLFVFLVQFVINAILDVCRLFWFIVRWWTLKLFPSARGHLRRTRTVIDGDAFELEFRSSTNESSELFSTISSYEANKKNLFRRLNKPPRPIHELIKVWEPPPEESIDRGVDLDATDSNADSDDSYQETRRESESYKRASIEYRSRQSVNGQVIEEIEEKPATLETTETRNGDGRVTTENVRFSTASEATAPHSQSGRRDWKNWLSSQRSRRSSSVADHETY